MALALASCAARVSPRRALWGRQSNSILTSGTPLRRFWAIMGAPEISDGGQKRPKKFNTATFWHPGAVWRLKKVILERVRKTIEDLLGI